MRAWIKRLLVDTVEAQAPPIARAIERFRPDLVAIDPMLYAAAIAAHEAGVPWATLSNSLNPALPGIVSVYDSIGMVQTSRRLHFHAQRLGAEIWYGHDPDQFAAMRKSPNAFYE